MKRLLLASSALIVLAAPRLAAAQSASTTVESLTVTGERDYTPKSDATATKTDTSILLTPQSVAVIPRAVLTDQKALVLTDAVRNVAGVSSDFGFNGSSQPILILRGFSTVSMTAQSAVTGMAVYYLDGVKMSGLPVNMADVEAVTVVKGPSTVLYGRAEPGGIINVISRPFSADRRVSLEQTVGSYGLSRSVVEASGAIDEDQHWLAKGSASYFNNGFDRDFVTDRLGAVSGALAWKPDARTIASLTLNYSDQRYRTDYGIPSHGDGVADVSRSRQFNNAPDLSSTESLSALGEFKHKFGDNWRLRATASYVKADVRELDIAPYRVDFGLNPTQTCDGTGANLCRYYLNARPDGHLEVKQAALEVTGKVGTGGLTHNLLFGLDAYSSDKTGTTYTQQLTSVSVAMPNFAGTAKLDPSLASASDRLDRDRWLSAYIQDQVDFGGGLHGIVALRHDWTSAVYDAPGVALNKIDYTAPRVGLVWEVQPGQTVYAQYQTALSANNGRDPISGVALAPEKSRQTEVGYKTVVDGGRLIATLAAYELVKRNRADLTLYPVVNTLGEATSRGIELDVIGQITARLAMIGSYAYTDAKVTDHGPYAGKRLANVPYNAGSVWARYALDTHWSFGGGVFYQGRRSGDIGQTFYLPDYTRVDLMAAYAFTALGSKASFQVNLNNALDKRYFTGSHQFSPDWIQQGPSRTLLATLRLEY